MILVFRLDKYLLQKKLQSFYSVLNPVQIKYQYCLNLGFEEKDSKLF